MPLTTDEELRPYLSSKDIPTHTVEALLAGGTANFVWRLTTLLGRTSIIKHAEPYVRSHATMAFPVERMGYEVEALRYVAAEVIAPQYASVETDAMETGVQRDVVVVVVPAVKKYIEADKVVWMEDGGRRNLKESYIDSKVEAGLDFVVLGARIGRFLAHLHNTTSTSQALPTIRAKFDNQPGKTIYRHAYNNVASALELQGFDRALGEHINERYGSLLETDEDCLCHGDFWPGNILLEDDYAEDSAQTAAPRLTVVDWEMTRIGNGATDVGQFAAEAWLLDRFHGGKGLLDAFLEAYLEGRPLSEEDRVRVAAHFGTHISYWPTRVEWTNEQGTRDVVSIGVKVLEAARSGRLEKLEDGPLKRLVEKRDT